MQGTHGFIDVKNSEVNRRPVPNNNDILVILQKQVVKRGEEEAFFRSCEFGSPNGYGGKFDR